MSISIPSVIHIDMSNKTPLKFVFKHELTHYLETSKNYKQFTKTVRKTKLYREWLIEKTGKDKDTSTAVLETTYRKMIEDSRRPVFESAIKELEQQRSEATTTEEQNILGYKIEKLKNEIEKLKSATFRDKEMIADFVGDKLFTDDMSTLQSLKADLSQKEYPAFIQAILDFFSWLKKKLGGQKQLTQEISKLEDAYNRLLSERTKNADTKVDGDSVIKFSNKSTKSLAENVAEIINMSNEDALKRKREDVYISILEHMPSIILENVEGAKDIETIMRFDAAYLAIRERGVLEGNYHNFGEDFANKLYSVLNSPDAIIRLNDGRINLFGQVANAKGKNSLVSIELNTVKDINNKKDAYNLIVTMMPLYDNFKYVDNLMKKAIKVEYKREDLLQVNPQLHTSLSIINNKSSDSTISQDNSESQDYSMQTEENNSSDYGNSFSIAITESGEKFTVIDKSSVTEIMSQNGDSLPAKVRQFLRKYRNTVLPIGSTDRVYFRRESENEYTNPAKRLDENIFDAKLKAASEIKNILSTSTYSHHENDDGRHPDAVRGWNYYNSVFVVPTDSGERVYAGVISIKLISRGDCFYDMTKIRDITDSSAGQTYLKAAGSVNNVSTYSIPNSTDNVNSYSISDENNSTEVTKNRDFTKEHEEIFNRFQNGEIDVDEYRNRH